MTRSARLLLCMVLGCAVLLIALGPRPAYADERRAAQARLAILDLDYPRAAKLLQGEDTHGALALERGRLALYRGECDDAVAALQHPDLQDDEASAPLLAAARGCARATAATLIVRAEQQGVVVRLQDDEDRALVYLIVDTATRTRDMIERELGARLPAPIFVDLVRDQFSLSAHTGLSEQAAQTTGTVAVAKWGRVIMVSPRAASSGFPWLDTLAHELTHLAVSQGTFDRAPLWLQEGVAKRQETRWRQPNPFDHRPPAETVAVVGMRRGMGRPLTGLGPSLAMLPTPAEASVAYAQVASFLQFWVAEVGEDGLPKLLEAVRDAPAGQHADSAMAGLTGLSLAEWEARWRTKLHTVVATLPPELAPGGQLPRQHEVARHARLGQLLLERDHFAAATMKLERAQQLAPHAPTVRCHLVSALFGLGEMARAELLVQKTDDVHHPTGRWWSLHDLLHPGERHARWRALAIQPLNPPVPCEEQLPPGVPSDDLRRALCEAARRVPR